MKKLMMAVAVVCAAVAANAASCTWNTGKMYYGGVGTELGDSSVATIASGTAYLFIISETAYNSLDTAAAIWSGFDAKNTKLTVGSETFTGEAKTIASNGKASFTATTAEKSTTAYAAFVVVEDGNKAYSANTVYGGVTTQGLSVTKGALGWGNKGLDGDATEWQAIPEPTSGLLLLLGVAGLALKRKRA